MSLSKAQREFTKDIGKLIAYAYSRGLELTFGDAYRDPRVHGELGESGPYGSPRSNHKRRLAVDFNLFKDGKYQSQTTAHWPLGVFWESLNPANRWGGRWEDGNHYERNIDG